MTGPVTASLTLPADVRSVGRARDAVREALHAACAADLVDSAQLAVSELVTNAVVHAGTDIELRILAAERALRVEIADGSPHLPVRRAWSPTSGTGRGLHVVDHSADRWDVEPAGGGKTVWFEIGDLPRQAGPDRRPGSSADGRARDDVVRVTLRDVPLLMHLAWQEHATTLLREYLLYAIEDDPAVLDRHAAAMDALAILAEQVPAPVLAAEPDELMADSVEPAVTHDQVVLRVPRESVANFAVLDDLLSHAVAAARDGLLLGPPTQPEIGEMRRWLCGQVAAQAAGEPGTPWRVRLDVHVLLDEQAALAEAHRLLAASDEPLIAADNAGLVVAVTQPVVRFLGYADEAELLGRRLLVVIPERYHQAHIAGLTFHATNGRDALLDRWITAPVVRADGSEVPVQIRVEPRGLGDRAVFVASLRLDPPR